MLGALVVYPLALTAGWYLIGFSMLGALAVAPLVPWLWLRRWYAASGAALVGAMLMKLNVTPVLAAPLLALVASSRLPDLPRRKAVDGGALGVLVAILAAAALLGVRGELRGYLETFAYNVHYASARTQADGFVGGMLEHLRIATDFFYLAGRWQLGLRPFSFSRSSASPPPTRRCSAIQIGVRPRRSLARDARRRVRRRGAHRYWYEHLQLLAYPATLMAAALIWRTTAAFGERWGLLAAVERSSSRSGRR